MIVVLEFGKQKYLKKKKEKKAVTIIVISYCTNKLNNVEK